MGLSVSKLRLMVSKLGLSVPKLSLEVVELSLEVYSGLNASLSLQAALETTKIHSVSGRLGRDASLMASGPQALSTTSYGE